MQYYHSDHLGSSTLVTDASGAVVSQSTFLPYGYEYEQTGSNNHYKFTGKERDSESGCDYFGARYYCATMGRWMSPDWSFDPRSFDIGNPQSLNRYAYVHNRPLVFSDSNGLWPEWIHNQIIDTAFRGVFRSVIQGCSYCIPYEIQVLKAASVEVDNDQSPANSYKHGMRAFFQPEDEARGQSELYVANELSQAVGLQVQCELRGFCSYSRPWAEEAMKHLGYALHTVTDTESLTHQGVQPWGSFNTPLHSGYHVGREIIRTSILTSSSWDIAESFAVYEAQVLWARFSSMLKSARPKKAK
jgi:RHS repeat-associated protein